MEPKPLTVSRHPLGGTFTHLLWEPVESGNFPVMIMIPPTYPPFH